MPALVGVAGVAAAFCLAPQALADPSATHSAAQHAVVTDAVVGLGPSSAHFLTAIKQATQPEATQHQAASSAASWYTVRPGDSLSAIAGRAYHNQDAWPVLYWANRNRVYWANVIEPGQVLRIPVEPGRIPDAPGRLGPAPAPTTQAATQAAAPSAAPADATAPGTVQASYSGGSPGGSFGQCVIARESGGNAQVMNSTGHYGLSVQRVDLGRVRRFLG